LIPNGDEYIIIACDSAGGIGEKEHDVVKTSGQIAGYYTAFVPIVEVLAIKGKIVSVVDTLAVEMEPTGRAIIKGIGDAMEDASIDRKLLTGSTEENIATSLTGIGVTLIGKVDQSKVFLTNKYLDSLSDEGGSRVWCQASHRFIDRFETYQFLLAGLPKVGEQFVQEEMIEGRGETLTLAEMKAFAQNDLIIDMIPVGSKGIAYEASVLAKRHQGIVELIPNSDISYHASAGPSTCLIILTKKTHIKEIIGQTNLPINIIGGLDFETKKI